MLWIKLPMVVGGSTVLKLFNLDFYKKILPYGEFDMQCQLVQDDDTIITIDLEFDILSLQITGWPNWKLLPILDEGNKLINLDFYKFVESSDDGCVLYQQLNGRDAHQEFTGAVDLTITLVNNFITGSIKLSKNGARLDNASFTEVAPNQLTLNVPRTVDDEFIVDYLDQSKIICTKSLDELTSFILAIKGGTDNLGNDMK